MMAAIVLRSFTWRDLEPLARLEAVVAGVHDSSSGAVEALQRRFAQPGAHPEEDGLLAWDGARLVGYVVLHREEALGRAVASGAVHPAYRRQGVGTRLLAVASARTRALGLVSLELEVPEDDGASVALLERMSFRRTFGYWQMRRDSQERVGVKVPADYVLRFVRSDEVAVLTDLQNRAFAGSPGYAPNTPEQVGYRLYSLRQRPDEVLVLALRDRLDAYCWLRHEGRDRSGFIEMLGVDPGVRGLGLGRAVTGAAVNRLLETGAYPLEINVVTTNEPAIGLYRGLGFAPVRTIRWFQCALG